jgi:alpha-mannosidase
VAGDHPVAPLVTVSNPAVVVEAVKLAEDGSGDLVVRLYESLGGRARTTVTAAAEVGSVDATDLLERPCPRVPPARVHLSTSSWPFQLVTLRFRR